MSSKNGKKPDHGRDYNSFKDEKGLFTKGNPGGTGWSGRKFHLIRQKLEKSTDADQAGRIWKNMMNMAEEGDIKAMIYVMDRILGKPKESMEISGTIDNDGVRGELIEYLRLGMSKN